MSFDQCRSFYCDCPSTRMGDFAWVDTQGFLRRTDGAAVVDGDTGWRWLRNGDRHRLDGPAIVYERDDHGWWLEGRKVTAHEVVAAWLAQHHPGSSTQVLETLATVDTTDQARSLDRARQHARAPVAAPWPRARARPGGRTSSDQG